MCCPGLGYRAQHISSVSIGLEQEHCQGQLGAREVQPWGKKQKESEMLQDAIVCALAAKHQTDTIFIKWHFNKEEQKQDRDEGTRFCLVHLTERSSLLGGELTPPFLVGAA